MFKTTGTGFQLTFANGWTLSVQWGPGTYSTNRDMAFGRGRATSSTAEIAAWDSNGTWYDFGTDTVKGYCSPDKVAQYIQIIANMPASA